MVQERWFVVVAVGSGFLTVAMVAAILFWH
jgi:hypothetical protein